MIFSRSRWLLLPAAACVALAAGRGLDAQTALPSSPDAQACSVVRLGANGAFRGFRPDPTDAWHRDVTNDPVAPNSDEFFQKSLDMGKTKLHPDFGTDNGIPYNVTDSASVPAQAVTIDLYRDQSDIAATPIPKDAVVEGPSQACEGVSGDQHLIVVDKRSCAAYEFWQASVCNGRWRAANMAIFDLATPEKRPFGYTSADAAGLSILEGLVRYDEIVAGHIDHAIRFTTRLTKKSSQGSLMVLPATHAAGQNTNTDNIMGMRIRLRKDFDVSHFSRTNQIILNAMKQYGMILADNGSTMYFQGTRDPRWNDEDLNELKQVASTEFEVLQMGPVRTTTETSVGPAPQIVAFTASPVVSSPGLPVTLQATLQDASYAYIAETGFLRGNSVTVRPTRTTTYTLTARNQYGTRTATVTVEVR